MKELLEALDGTTNVKSIKYDTETTLWTVYYKNGLPVDKMKSDELIIWLKHG